MNPTLVIIVKDYCGQVAKFVEEECIPADAIYEAQLGVGKDRWTQPPIVEHLKERAKELGLWNMFLAKGHYKEGAGFTNLEYGLMAEHLGKSRTASEVRNWLPKCLSTI